MLGILSGLYGIFSIFRFILIIAEIIGAWNMFEKAGEDGWKSIIPIYGVYIFAKISWTGSMFWIMPIACILYFIFSAINLSVGCFIMIIVLLVWWIIMQVKLARKFEKGIGFTIGLILLNPIFICILGFGDASYDPFID
jgi:hypothetical protein